MELSIEVVEERKNPLLRRREIKCKASYMGATPSHSEVKNKIVAMLNLDPKLVVVDYIRPEYGKQVAHIYVEVYDDEEAMSIEPKHKLMRERKEGEGGGEEGKESGEGEGSEGKVEEKDEKGEVEKGVAKKVKIKRR